MTITATGKIPLKYSKELQHCIMRVNAYFNYTYISSGMFHHSITFLDNQSYHEYGDFLNYIDTNFIEVKPSLFKKIKNKLIGFLTFK